MIKNILNILRKIIPQPVLLFYHGFLAYLASFIYGYPSNKMVVIGVTGTSGKSTVINLIGQILEQAGYKVGLTTTFNLKVGKEEKVNKYKMTMLGPFILQKLLKQMLDTGCQYAVIETTSQGIKQYRHLEINYDVGVFTNLSKEHIESHGGYEKYRQVKEKLFKHISKSNKKIINGRKIEKISVINFDDKEKEHFLKYSMDKKYGYGIKNDRTKEVTRVLKAENIELKYSGSEFNILGSKFKINLLGKFNILNALSAICVAGSQNINLDVCRKALINIKQIPGRMEIIIDNPFTVIVDYAHTPEQLEKVYKTIRNRQSSIFNHKLICVLGSAGGGRDKWKRPIMGKIAEKYGNEIIITNEDPYDENPEKIIQEIIKGIKTKRVYKILDRREAIKKALSLAQKGDIVIITGKGCEPWIMSERGKRIPWDDRRIVKELINNPR